MLIPMWKWKQITNDFVVGLPTSMGGFDSIWVVVERLTMFAHFISIKVKYIVEKLCHAPKKRGVHNDST